MTVLISEAFPSKASIIIWDVYFEHAIILKETWLQAHKISSLYMISVATPFSRIWQEKKVKGLVSQGEKALNEYKSFLDTLKV